MNKKTDEKVDKEENDEIGNETEGVDENTNEKIDDTDEGEKVDKTVEKVNDEADEQVDKDEVEVIVNETDDEEVVDDIEKDEKVDDIEHSGQRRSAKSGRRHTILGNRVTTNLPRKSNRRGEQKRKNEGISNSDLNLVIIQIRREMERCVKKPKTSGIDEKT